MADAAYGLWPLVILNTILFIVFAVSLFHPKTKRDWRAMGAYSAFLVALFTEMYGTTLLPARQLVRLPVPAAEGHPRGRTPVERPDQLAG
ncbi:hypothetical protein GCM10019016_079190 [Streptomyces prasinosporus]|uniref:Uncharacterized protein n=2 Tax=Streptomyces TaxID=1883 RepID=A0ABP6TZH2_9ACTN|nr:hypothetical protein [Streptomyces tricolor]MCG0062749.1 hypothetical protein [Streptomyces tricolor]GHC13754.1 hypothetical protein GCM10010332_49410 [Streptomyces albogriseolus]